MQSPSVIIIGAGPSGIAAGTKLLESFIDNITILEAEDRIGGRIYTKEFGDTFVELGAEYCHGEKNNIVYELTRDLDVLEPGVDSIYENIYYSNGSKLTGECIEEMRNLILDYENTEIDGFIVEGKSVGQCFTYRYNSTLMKKYGNHKEYEQILKEGIHFSEGYIVMVEGTSSWEDSSIVSSYKACEGDQSFVWKKLGYKNIFDVLTHAYPTSNRRIPIYDKIQLNSKVERIFWNQDSTIKVVTSDNTSYLADYVIFTPSIGVLKQTKDTLFSPPLPRSKQDSIDAMGFSGVMKVVVRFPQKWWKDEDRAFSFFWSEKDLNGTEFAEGPNRNGISWVTQLREVSRVLHNSNVWIGWFGGDLVPEIEKLSLDVLKRGCQYVFDKFLSRDYAVGRIDTIFASKWCSNPNFGGVYSFVKTGKCKENLTHQEVLGQPLRNGKGKISVLFAGEATNPIHYATVHGAIESGFREAQRIIDLQESK